MCLREYDQTPHACFQDCPLCWSFTTDTLTEEGVLLGTFHHLSEIADAGCWLCQYVRQQANEHKLVVWYCSLLLQQNAEQN